MSNIPSDSLRDILARAASDADFRAKCLTDPADALREAGVEVPAGTTIAFSETPDGSAITLPGFVEDADEIRDAEVLDSIAGGGHNPTGSDRQMPPSQFDDFKPPTLTNC